jgi:hypothetical protein
MIERQVQLLPGESPHCCLVIEVVAAKRAASSTSPSCNPRQANNMYYSDGDSEGSEDTYGEDERVIEELSPFLNNSTYACGGTVLVGKQTDQRQDNITEPVVIRWDAGEVTNRLTLPFPPKTAKKTGNAILQGLIDDMEPASFGFQGKDIVDDSYRKAVKLDTSAFATNFCPYKVGIIDTLGHALLPIWKAPFQGIYADLHKLNVSRVGFDGNYCHR